MIFILAIIFILIKYFGFIDSSWELIFLFLASFAAIAFSIINGDDFTSSYAYALSLQEKVDELEEKLNELEAKVRDHFDPIDAFSKYD